MTIDETARQIVDTAWAEFTNTVGPSAMPLHPEMRALMMALVTSGMKVEREACAEILKDESLRQMEHRKAAKLKQEQGEFDMGATAVTFLHTAQTCQRMEDAIRARSTEVKK